MLRRNKSSQFKLEFGPLPTTCIYATLEIELEDGEVVMSARAQQHSAKRHPDDFKRCLPHVAAIIRDPLYLGDDFRNPGKIEFIGRVAALESGLLVAVEITRDSMGHYNVASIYPISETKIQNRLRKKHLFRAKNKPPAETGGL